jgi:methylglutaconyl-CoA hydratase
MSEKIVTQVDAAGTATVRLNRPQVHNAFDPEMVAALAATLERLEREPSVRAVVLTGAGENFCAGADIEHMRASARLGREQNLEAARATARMLYSLYRLAKPTVACVRGAVRGGGVGLVAACDIALGARGATFRLSEAKLGIIPAMISPYVIAAIGSRQARRYMLSGEEFDALEAQRIGLLHAVCAESELDGALERVLAQLRTSGPGALAAIKRLVPEVAGARIDDALVEMTAERIAEVRASAEAEEGLSAFLEKRRPAWARPARAGGDEG